MYALAVLGFLVVFLGGLVLKKLGSRPLKRISTPSMPSVLPALSSAKPLSWEDEMVVSLEALRRSIREKAKEDSKQLQDEISDARSRLASILDTAEKLRITEAMTAIAEEIRHWDAWSKNPAFNFQKERIVDGLLYLGGTSSRDKGVEQNTNEFVFQNRRYRLSVTEQLSSQEGMTRSAELVLEGIADEQYDVIFRADIRKDLSIDSSFWSVFRVTLFKAGEWIHDMVLLHELIRVRREQRFLQREAEHILLKAASI